VIYEVPAVGANPATLLDLSWDFLERPVFWPNAAGNTYFADVERGYVKVVSSHTPRTAPLAPEPAPIGASNVSALTRFGERGIVVYDAVSQEAYSIELEPLKKSHRYNFAIPDYVFPASTREVIDIDAKISYLTSHTEMISALYLTDLGIVRHEVIRDTSDPTQRPQMVAELTKFFPTFKHTISLPMGGSLAVRRPLQMKRDGNNVWVMADAREDGANAVVIICYRLDFSGTGRYSVEHVEDITLMHSPEMLGFMDFKGQQNLLIRDADDVSRLGMPAFHGLWAHNAVLSTKRVVVPSGLDATQLQNLTLSQHADFPKVHLPQLPAALGGSLVLSAAPLFSPPTPVIAGGFNYPPQTFFPIGSLNTQNLHPAPPRSAAVSQLISQALGQPHLSGQPIFVGADSEPDEAPEVILKRRAELMVSLCWNRWRGGSGKSLSGLPENPVGEIGAAAFAVFLNSMEADAIVAAWTWIVWRRAALTCA
jgi:hypothetical protein